MVERTLESKIIDSLFESPKTFNQILKSVVISRPVLAKKLKSLKNDGLIYKESRKSPYYISSKVINFPIFHSALAYVLFKEFNEERNKDLMKLIEIDYETFLSLDDSKRKEMNNKLKTQMFKYNLELITTYETFIGRLFLHLLALKTTDNKFDAIEIIKVFLNLFYHFLVESDDGLFRESLVSYFGEVKNNKIISLRFGDIQEQVYTYIRQDAERSAIYDCMNSSINDFNRTNETNKKLMHNNIDSIYVDLGILNTLFKKYKNKFNDVNKKKLDEAFKENNDMIKDYLKSELKNNKRNLNVP